MKNLDKKPLVLISADNLTSMKEHLKFNEYNFSEAVGVYKGVKETSFLIEIDNENDIQDILRLAYIHSQESIAYIGVKRVLSLIYIGSDKIEKIGKLNPYTEKEFDKLDARFKDNYTIFNGYYWIAHKEL